MDANRETEQLTFETAPRELTQADIDAAIQAWNGSITSKHAVNRHMEHHARDRGTLEFLRGEYGGDYPSFPVSVNGIVHEVPWPKVQRRIYQLIQEDRFYTQDEYNNLDDIDPVAIREALAEHGIINGEVVDPAALDNSPVIQEITAAAEQQETIESTPSQEKLTTPPPVFFVNWEAAQHDFDLGRYNDHDVIGYDKDGVEYALGRSGSLTYVTGTGMLMGGNSVPGDIYEQLTAYREGNLTGEQVRKNYLRIIGGSDPEESLKPHSASANTQMRHNFRITDEHLGADQSDRRRGFAPKTAFRNNIAAIHALSQIEADNRLATPEEQKILSRYVGWGGLPMAFDTENQSWANEYTELKSLLTPEEYESARASTLNAHYTSSVVIKAMYETLERLGVKDGNILEPACGIGNFFGLIPESMENARLYGVELDSITGRIAKQLYQNADIHDYFFGATRF